MEMHLQIPTLWEMAQESGAAASKATRASTPDGSCAIQKMWSAVTSARTLQTSTSVQTARYHCVRSAPDISCLVDLQVAFHGVWRTIISGMRRVRWCTSTT